MTTPSDGLFLSSKPIQIQKDLGLELQDMMKDVLDNQTFAIKSGDELYLNSVQCAAVSTHFSLIKVPPQKMNDDVEERESPTCHPISPFAASSPPTTFGSNLLLLLNAFFPQKHLDHGMIQR